MFIEESILIENKLGLHARAAVQLVELTREFDATITVCAHNKSVTTDSVMGLLLLESAQGEHITIRAEGHDAKQALQAVKNLVSARFHEDE